MNPTTLPLLGKDRNNKDIKVWKIHYKCSGCRHCEFVPEHMLKPNPAYDDVDIEKLYALQHQGSRKFFDRSISERLRDKTLALYNSFMVSWTANRFTCKNKHGISQCPSSKRPQTWIRNGVSTCLAYAQNPLTKF